MLVWLKTVAAKRANGGAATKGRAACRRATRRVAPVMAALEARQLLSAVSMDLGIRRPSDGGLVIDYGNNGSPDSVAHFGLSTDKVAVGDFDGNTVSDVALYRGGTWLIYLNGHTTPDRTEAFGGANGVPVVGDVNGDGKADLGVYNPATGVWRFDTNGDGVADLTVKFGGHAGDVPLLGDFNNDGKADLVIYNAGTWSINTQQNGVVNRTYHFGNAAATPVLADINGDTKPDLGLFTNGTWVWDTNRDGTPDVMYALGQAGDVPIAGYFNTAHSVFVAPGGTGNGSEFSPMGSVRAAADVVWKQGAAGNNTVIRIAPGTYTESVYLFGDDGVTFFGAGQHAVVINPPTGNAIMLDHTTNTWIYNLDVASGDIGVLDAGSSVSARGLTVEGTMNKGFVAAGYNGVGSQADLWFDHFDKTVCGIGLVAQNDCTVIVQRSTASSNGTNPALCTDLGKGLGVAVENNAVCNIKNADLSNNVSSGIHALQGGTVRLRMSTLNYNQKFDGIAVGDSATALIKNNTFVHNGQTRSAQYGTNGVEIDNNFTGAPVQITGNTFADATSAGIYVGNGTGHVIAGNSFYNCLIGVNVNGSIDASISTVPVNTSATIIGNTFAVPAGSTNTTGVFAAGSGAHAVVGGSGPGERNSFTNYPAFYSIVGASTAYNPPQAVGSPHVTVGANDFINSPNPLLGL